MKKQHRFFTLALVMVFVVTSVQLSFAKDAADAYWKNPENVRVNETIYNQFETSKDSDCFTFISGGGSYKLQVCTKESAGYEEIYEEYMLPLEVQYSGFEKFSAAAGAKAQYQPGSIIDVTWLSGKQGKDGWYTTTIKLGKFKKNQKVYVQFQGSKKGKYKFKITGKASSAPNKVVLNKARGSKKAMTVQWKKTKNAKGYKVQLAKDEGFTKGLRTYYVNNGTLRKKVENLKKGEYYVRVSAFKRISGAKNCGRWSTAKK